MTTRISAETRAHIARRWPDILQALARGELVKDILAAEGIGRNELYAFKVGNAQLQAEWESAREASALLNDHQESS